MTFYSFLLTRIQFISENIDKNGHLKESYIKSAEKYKQENLIRILQKIIYKFF